MSPSTLPARPTPILCDRIVGNLSSLPADRFAGKSADRLPLTWLDCTRRAFRKTTARGRAIAVLLPVGFSASHGDVLHEEDDFYVAVDVQPCDLWLVSSSDRAALARVALELGNLHVPVEATAAGELLTPPDGPTEGILRRNGASFTVCRRRFSPMRATVTSGLSAAKSMRVLRQPPPTQLTNSRE